MKYSYFYNTEAGQSVEAIRAGNIIATSDMIILNNFRKTELFSSASGALLGDISAPNLSFSPIAVAEKALILSNDNGLLTYVPSAPGTAPKPIADLQSISPLRLNTLDPYNSSTSLNVLLSEDADVIMNVINSNNQIVRTQDKGILKAGQNSISWDARDNEGKTVPYGQYHFSLDLKDSSGSSAHYDYPDKFVTVGDTSAVTLTDLNMRSGPGTQYSIIRVVPTSAYLRITDENDGWFKVDYSGTSDYVSKRYVSTQSNPVLVTTLSTANYIVQPGDTLYKIAAKNNTTVPTILSVNKLANPNVLSVGQPLAIPVIVQQPVSLIHVVVAGDTLWKISNYYNVPMAIIIKNNPSINPNNLFIGQRLLIR